MHRLFVGSRPLRRCHPSLERPRYYVRLRVDRPVAGAPGLQAANGLAISVGLVARKRLQLRLRRCLYGGAAEKRCRLQLPSCRRARAAEGGHERVRAPERRRPSHLLYLFPRRPGVDGDLSVPRPRAAGQERGCARIPASVVAPARRVRQAMSEPVVAVRTRGRDGPCCARSEQAFFCVSALLFAVCAAVTIVWCAPMSVMGEMTMPGGWTMSMD